MNATNTKVTFKKNAMTFGEWHVVRSDSGFITGQMFVKHFPGRAKAAAAAYAANYAAKMGFEFVGEGADFSDRA